MIAAMMNKKTGKRFGGSVFVVVVAAIVATVAAAMSAQAAVRSGAVSVATPRAATTTFHFNNIPVRSALQLIAEEGHFNLVVSDSVQGTISLHLANVTWEQALDVVLQLKGLAQHVEGNTRAVTGAGG